MNQQVQFLVTLQDLDQMVLEAEDDFQSKQEQDMGFEMPGLQKLKQAREDLLGQIESRHRGYYQRLATRYDRAVVPVLNNFCTGCFANIPFSFTSTVNENKVLHCESCGRILYWP